MLHYATYIYWHTHVTKFRLISSLVSIHVSKNRSIEVTPRYNMDHGDFGATII